MKFGCVTGVLAFLLGAIGGTSIAYADVVTLNASDGRFKIQGGFILTIWCF